jgi:hypothetical protein
MRWMSLIVVVAVLGVGCGEDEPEWRGVPAPEAPPEGTNERADWEVQRILDGFVPGDEERVARTLERLEALRAEWAGREPERGILDKMLLILEDEGRHLDAAAVRLAMADLTVGLERFIVRHEAARDLILGARDEQALNVLDETLATMGADVPEAMLGSLRLERAWVLARLDRLDEALSSVRAEAKRLEGTSRGRLVQYQIALMLLRAGQDDEARASLKEIWDKYGGSPVGEASGLQLAGILAREDRKEDAFEILRRIGRFGEPSSRAWAAMWQDSVSLVGEAAPALAGIDLDGKHRDLRGELQGRFAVVLFWDPGNASSRVALRDWASRVEGLARAGGILIGVPLQPDRNLIRRALRDTELDETVQIHVGPDAGARWRVRRVPWAVIVDAGGRVRAVGWPTGRLVGLPVASSSQDGNGDAVDPR